MKQEEAAEHDEGQCLRGDTGDGYQCHAQVERRIGLRMLDRVAGFVGGDAECGEAGAVIVVLAQSEALIGRIVVIGQRAVAFDDLDVVDAGAFHHRCGGFAAGDASTRGHLHIFAVSAFDFHLRPQADGNRNENE